MSDPDSPAARVERWEASGGYWRVLSSSGGRFVVALERCDGGEELDRVISDDPALAAWLGGRTESG